MNSGKNQGMERFDQELRRWGNRPPQTPPDEAGRRITSTLIPVRTGLPVWRMAAAAAAVVLLICGTWAGLTFTDSALPHVRSTEAPGHSAEFVPPPLDENVVLWWLDDETPVYFVLNTGDSG
jgi:hypothetical protein